MHKYLKAIGFQNVTSEKEWNRILIQSEEEFTDYQRISLEEELDFGELRKEYGMGIGIYSYGQIDEYETYTREYLL